MSKDDLKFKITNIISDYDLKSDYFTLQADMMPLSYQGKFILSSKILSYHEDTLINVSENTLMLFENEENSCIVYDGISQNGGKNPNKFDVNYRIFNFIQENTLNIKLPGPPELSRKGGSFIVHQPERNFIGANKWKFGSISIESIQIRKLEDSFEMSFNLENKGFLSSIPIIEIKGENWAQKTQPILAENSKFQVSLNIYEEIDSSDFDFNFMFFEASKSEKLSDQVVPEPEIEQSGDSKEDNNEINQDEMNDEVDWNDVGKRAFNQYFNWYRKSENHDECQELANEEIANAMEDIGIDIETNWEVDLDKEKVKSVIQSFAEKMRDIHEEVGYKVGGVLLWPMHTWIIDKLYDAKEKHNDDNYFKDLNDFISIKLPDLLPSDDDEIQTQDIQKTKEVNSQLKFILNKLSSEIDEESYLNFSCDFEVQNLKEKKSFCEYQIILLQGEDKNTPLSNCNAIYTGRSEKCALNQSNNELYLSCNVKINGTLTPNKFLLRYRFFDEVGSFKFSPKLPNKKEPVVFNLPDKSVDGGNKWGGKGIEIKSMRIKIDDGDRHNDSYFNYNYNLICNKLNSFGLNFSWMTSSYPDESDDFEILQHEYSTFRGDFKSSKDVKVLCRIFQASEWKEYSDNNIFTTDS